MTEIFTGNFTQQEAIPQEGIDAAMAVLQSGRLHRYNVAEGELGEVSLLEQEFAAQLGVKYCLAVASGGYAMGAALRAMEVAPGDKVLTNAFTLAPVPGAIASVGAVPIFVGVTEDLVIDMKDLEAKAHLADVLMLSHMRGHLCDMEALIEICRAHNIRVIEDCAHTMGARWKGKASGLWGDMACYSTQTYKHVNSGEGGLLVSDDPDLMARATILSGSYMLYERHGAVPPAEAFEKIKYTTPNVSGRMDHLRAAILRPQLRNLAEQAERWNARYFAVEQGLRDTPGLTIVERPEEEYFVGSSIQFLLLDWSSEKVNAVMDRCKARGVELKWFGGQEPVAFTSRYASWAYAPSEPMAQSDRVLDGIMDMRIPLTFSLDDCALIARIIRAEVSAVYQSGDQ